MHSTEVRPTGCAAGITQGWAAANGADALLVPGEETVKKTFEKWRTSMSSSECVPCMSRVAEPDLWGPCH